MESGELEEEDGKSGSSIKTIISAKPVESYIETTRFAFSLRSVHLTLGKFSLPLALLVDHGESARFYPSQRWSGHVPVLTNWCRMSRHLVYASPAHQAHMKTPGL
ncbi:hypothetical protein RRG08_049070 [Elysia crispata]|uniref:Uncharacterized protein n=1 Tax=Elysia crispata TaxID=231223 RepID=A0AAE1A9S4_9GAST|nr:hypothetical protein RRG08_049070 [Elysia crispata]